MLLVVYETGVEHSLSYSVDFTNGKVGHLGGGRYAPIDFFGCGFVSYWIYDGYSLASELQADITMGEDSIILSVGGPSDEAKKGDHYGEQLSIYNRKIVLSPHGK